MIKRRYQAAQSQLQNNGQINLGEFMFKIDDHQENYDTVQGLSDTLKMIVNSKHLTNQSIQQLNYLKENNEDTQHKIINIGNRSEMIKLRFKDHAGPNTRVRRGKVSTQNSQISNKDNQAETSKMYKTYMHLKRKSASKISLQQKNSAQLASEIQSQSKKDVVIVTGNGQHIYCKNNTDPYSSLKIDSQKYFHNPGQTIKTGKDFYQKVKNKVETRAKTPKLINFEDLGLKKMEQGLSFNMNPLSLSKTQMDSFDRHTLNFRKDIKIQSKIQLIIKV